VRGHLEDAPDKISWHPYISPDAGLFRVLQRATPSVLPKRANRSSHEIRRTSGSRAAVVVNDLRAFHHRTGQEQGSSQSFETFSEVCLFAELDAVLKSGMWVRGALSDCQEERFHYGDPISSR
jgi:hypothetical protein